jgi:hypothetical protein
MSNYESNTFGGKYARHQVTGMPLLFEDNLWLSDMFEAEEQAKFLGHTRESSKAVGSFRSVDVLSATYEGCLHYYTVNSDRSKVTYYCRVVDYPKPTGSDVCKFYPEGVPKELLKPLRVQKEVSYNPTEPRLRGLADSVFRRLIVSKDRNACTDNQQSVSAQKFWRRNLELLLKQPNHYSVYGVTFDDPQIPRHIVEVWPEIGDKSHFQRFATSYGKEPAFQNKRLMVVKKL